MEINITTMALMITSAATVIYATLTYLSLQETRREKKKPIIEEILGVVLYPLLHFLSNEVLDFKENNARLSFIRGKFRPDGTIKDLFSWGADTLVYEDFRKGHPNIAKMISEHNAFFTKLIAEADSIAKVLYTPKFRKKCITLIYKWDEDSEEHSKISEAFDKDHLTENIMYYIVNNLDSLPEGHFMQEFWDQHHEVFFKERERLAKQQRKNLENTLNDLERFTENLLTETKKLIERYKNKYDVSAKFVTDNYQVYKTYL